MDLNKYLSTNKFTRLRKHSNCYQLLRFKSYAIYLLYLMNKFEEAKKLIIVFIKDCEQMKENTLKLFVEGIKARI